MHSPLFAESFSITTYVLTEVGNTKRAIDARGLHEPGEKFIESEEREGYVRVKR